MVWATVSSNTLTSALGLAGGVASSRGPHLVVIMLQKCDILLWNFGKWDFPHVTHFRFFGWVLGRFPEIVYPVNVEHCWGLAVARQVAAGRRLRRWRLGSPVLHSPQIKIMINTYK